MGPGSLGRSLLVAVLSFPGSMMIKGGRRFVIFGFVCRSMGKPALHIEHWSQML